MNNVNISTSLYKVIFFIKIMIYLNFLYLFSPNFSSMHFIYLFNILRSFLKPQRKLYGVKFKAPISLFINVFPTDLLKSIQRHLPLNLFHVRMN